MRLSSGEKVQELKKLGKNYGASEALISMFTFLLNAFSVRCSFSPL
jgi:hypothetical protein